MPSTREAIAQIELLKNDLNIFKLSPETLISTFLKFNSYGLVVYRRVCKEWLEIIDANKPLWRTLKWCRSTPKKKEKSFTSALDLYDERSGSTLEDVSIRQKHQPFRYLLEKRHEITIRLQLQEVYHLIDVLGKSTKTLRCLVLVFNEDASISTEDQKRISNLAFTLSNLTKFIFWEELHSLLLPLAH